MNFPPAWFRVTSSFDGQFNWRRTWWVGQRGHPMNANDRKSNGGRPSLMMPFAMSLMVAVALALTIAPQTAAAQSGARSGKAVVDAVCIACHGSGANGAPKIGDKKAWSKRAAQGLTGLHQERDQRDSADAAPWRQLRRDRFRRSSGPSLTWSTSQAGDCATSLIHRTGAATARTGEQVVDLSLQAKTSRNRRRRRRPRLGTRRPGYRD